MIDWQKYDNLMSYAANPKKVKKECLMDLLPFVIYIV